jgi:hypothetical protein
VPAPPDTATLKRQIIRFLHEQRDAQGLPMPKVIYITSPNEIPAEQKYMLVMYGEEYEQTRHPLGLTITVARQQSKTVSDLSFLTPVHTAKEIAKREDISTIYACK